jgi:hypothetical protein
VLFDPLEKTLDGLEGLAVRLAEKVAVLGCDTL